MRWQERILKTGFEYKAIEKFGEEGDDGSFEITCVSPVKLSDSKEGKKMLDDMVLLILKQDAPAQTVEGTVKTKKGDVLYRLVRTGAWGNEEDTCKNTHTSTRKQVKESIVTSLLKMSGLSWCKRFVEAFRRAYRSMK